MELRCRPARRSDDSALAVLVDNAGEGMAAHMWQGLAQPGPSTLELKRERARPLVAFPGDKHVGDGVLMVKPPPKS